MPAKAWVAEGVARSASRDAWTRALGLRFVQVTAESVLEGRA